MTRADRIVIAIIAVVALVSWPIVASGAGRSADTVTISGPMGVTTVPLSQDGVYDVEGTLGGVRVRVTDGEVCVVDAVCPDRICELTGAVSSPGAVIACVPNGVTVRIGGSGRDGLDARVR